MPRTTKAQFKHFISICKHWQNRFGLVDWELDFEHTKLEKGTEADCTVNRGSRRASVKLSTELPYKLNNKEIETAAFHEIAHVLFAKLDDLAQSRYVFPTEVDEEIHAIIARMTNAFILD